MSFVRNIVRYHRRFAVKIRNQKSIFQERMKAENCKIYHRACEIDPKASQLNSFSVIEIYIYTTFYNLFHSSFNELVAQ